MSIAALTQIQAAALLSVAPRTLRDWHDCPRNPDGSYNGPSLVAYYVAKLGGSNEFDDQRQRLAAAQAERVENENAVRRGELADMNDVARFWTECIANARAKLLSLPAKLGPRLVNIGDAGTIANALRGDINAALAELALYEPRDDGEPGEVVAEVPVHLEPTARTDGQPVGRPRKKTQQRKRG